jgi:phytoene synthase
MTPAQYVEQKAAASGSSFYYAFLFLPAPRRAAITAFYAFCREVDDVVDDAVDLGVAATKLAWWSTEVAQAYAGRGWWQRAMDILALGLMRIILFLIGRPY